MRQFLVIASIFVLSVSCVDDSFEIANSSAEFTKIVPVSYPWWMDHNERVMSAPSNGRLIFGDPDELYQVNDDGTNVRIFNYQNEWYWQMKVNSNSTENNIVYREIEDESMYFDICGKDMKPLSSLSLQKLPYDYYYLNDFDRNIDASRLVSLHYGENQGERKFIVSYFENSNLKFQRDMPYDTLLGNANYWYNGKVILNNNGGFNLVRTRMTQNYDSELWLFEFNDTGKVTNASKITTGLNISDYARQGDKFYVFAEPSSAQNCELQLFCYDLSMNNLWTASFPHCTAFLTYAGNGELFVEDFWWEDRAGTRTIFHYTDDGTLLGEYRIGIEDFRLLQIQKMQDDAYGMVVSMGNDDDRQFFVMKRPASRLFDLF